MANVVARSTDGVRFEPVAEVTKDRFGAESLERPALVAHPGRPLAAVRELRDTRAPSTGGSTCWRPTPRTAWPTRRRAPCCPAATRHARQGPGGVHHDGLWHLWASVHPLDVPRPRPTG